MPDPDPDLNYVMELLAADVNRTGRVAPATEIRRRGEAQRNKHRIGAVAAAVVAAGVVAAGIAVGGVGVGRRADLPAGPPKTPAASADVTTTPPAPAGTGPAPAPAGTGPPPAPAVSGLSAQPTDSRVLPPPVTFPQGSTNR